MSEHAASADVGRPPIPVSGAWRWMSGIFAVLFLIAALIRFVSPENTFAALAETLGFLFLLVGMWWMVRAC